MTTTRDHVAIVCRDCGEVTHHDLAGVRPGAMLSCNACGLTFDPSTAHAPALNLLALGASSGPPRRAPGRIARTR